MTAHWMNIYDLMCDEGSVFCSSPYNLIHPILSYSTPYSLYPYVSCTIINQPHQASGGPPPTFSSPMTVTGPCIWTAKKKKTKTKVKSFSPCELLCLTILDRSLIVVDPKTEQVRNYDGISYEHAVYGEVYTYI